MHLTSWPGILTQCHNALQIHPRSLGLSHRNTPSMHHLLWHQGSSPPHSLAHLWDGERGSERQNRNKFVCEAAEASKQDAWRAWNCWGGGTNINFFVLLLFLSPCLHCIFCFYLLFFLKESHSWIFHMHTYNFTQQTLWTMQKSASVHWNHTLISFPETYAFLSSEWKCLNMDKLFKLADVTALYHHCNYYYTEQSKQIFFPEKDTLKITPNN